MFGFRFRRAWLIEWGYVPSTRSAPTYFGGIAHSWPWTLNRNRAIRFDRRCDACAMIRIINKPEYELRAVEHAWSLAFDTDRPCGSVNGQNQKHIEPPAAARHNDSTAAGPR